MPPFPYAKSKSRSYDSLLAPKLLQSEIRRTIDDLPTRIEPTKTGSSKTGPAIAGPVSVAFAATFVFAERFVIWS